MTVQHSLELVGRLVLAGALGALIGKVLNNIEKEL